MPNTFDEPPDTSDSDKREYAAREKAMDAALEVLRGMFDGLVIIGTWTLEDGATASQSRHDGNFFAQNGVADWFLKKRLAGAALDAADQHRPQS